MDELDILAEELKVLQATDSTLRGREWNGFLFSRRFAGGYHTIEKVMNWR